MKNIYLYVNEDDRSLFILFYKWKSYKTYIFSSDALADIITTKVDLNTLFFFVFQMILYHFVNVFVIMLYILQPLVFKHHDMLNIIYIISNCLWNYFQIFKFIHSLKKQEPSSYWWPANFPNTVNTARHIRHGFYH